MYLVPNQCTQLSAWPNRQKAQSGLKRSVPCKAFVHICIYIYIYTHIYIYIYICRERDIDRERERDYFVIVFFLECPVKLWTKWRAQGRGLRPPWVPAVSTKENWSGVVVSLKLSDQGGGGGSYARRRKRRRRMMLNGIGAHKLPLPLEIERY